jgi:hypothetical protein
MNPLTGVPCAWDVDDHFRHEGYGYLAAGTRVQGSLCVVADEYDNFGGDDHMLFASVYAPEDSLTVTLTNDRGVARPLEPVPDGNGYRWYVCHVDHTPDPYPEIPDSNGGTGLPVTYTLDLAAGSRTVRSIYAILEHPLIGTDPGTPWPLARRSSPATTGALVRLQFALNFLARSHLLAGELTTVALMIEEDRVIAEATGKPPLGTTEMTLAAWRGQEAQASELIQATLQEVATRGLSGMVNPAVYASSVLYNGLGRHDAARDAARRAFERDQMGYGPLVVPELAEAASRTGDTALVEAALEWLSERTRVTPTEWKLGIEARARALLTGGDDAERLHRESIARLARTRVRVELARAHLLYGEWLRRERRRVDAREQLRTAHDMLAAMGAEAFAERARRELLATGETVRQRTLETRDELTAQEAQIARLARDGLSNPEIGTACSSVRARSSTTCARSSPSSTSAHATSSTASCPATPSRRRSRQDLSFVRPKVAAAPAWSCWSCVGLGHHFDSKPAVSQPARRAPAS